MDSCKPVVALMVVVCAFAAPVPSVRASSSGDTCAGFVIPADAATAVVVTFSSIVREIQQNPELATFAAMIEAAGLGDELHSRDEFTVFAPTNTAFDSIPTNVLEAILADSELATAIVGSHVIAGDGLSLMALVEMGTVVARSGEELTFVADDLAVAVNGHSLGCAEVLAGNGTLHVLDVVLLPPGLTIGVPPSSAPGSTTAAFDAN